MTEGIRDETLHRAFQFRTGSSALREQLHLAFAKMKANPPQRSPLHLDSVVYTDDGLRCRWKEPRKVHTAWSFFHRVIKQLPGASLQGEAWGLAGADPVPPVASATPVSDKDPASSQSADREQPVQVIWPRFKARRLSLGPKGVAGLGPKRSAYKFGEKAWARSLWQRVGLEPGRP